MTQLLPCPFCGASDLVQDENGYKCKWIVCNGCGVTLDDSPHGDCADLWNARVPAQRMPGREDIAKIIWHRYAADHHETWEDEQYQSEYLDCADAILSALTSTSSECPGCGKIEADSTHAEGCSFAPAEGKTA